MTRSLPSQWNRTFRLAGNTFMKSSPLSRAQSFQWPSHLKRALRRDLQLSVLVAVAFSWLSVSGYTAFTAAQAQDLANHQMAADKNQTEQLEEILQQAGRPQNTGVELSAVHLDHSFINRYSKSVLQLTGPDDDTDEPLHLEDQNEDIAIDLFLKELETLQRGNVTTQKPTTNPWNADLTLTDPVAKNQVNVTSKFGWRHGRRHNGIDYAAPIGTTIQAAAHGKVLSAGWESGYGKMITIQHGNGIVTRYAHCSKMLVHAGQKVKKGQAIGKIGMTGHSTGPHVHFELMANGVHVNPARYTNQTGKLVALRTGHKL